jgi:hypothetical protein
MCANFNCVFMWFPPDSLVPGLVFLLKTPAGLDQVDRSFPIWAMEVI